MFAKVDAGRCAAVTRAGARADFDDQQEVIEQSHDIQLTEAPAIVAQHDGSAALCEKSGGNVFGTLADRATIHVVTIG